MNENIQLEFECTFDARTIEEVRDKGYFQYAVAVLPDGRRVRLSFWDPIRLSQDMETETRLGRSCIGEPGLIIVPHVTPDSMLAAVKELYSKGYFERLR
jgi:hypothetical protein